MENKISKKDIFNIVQDKKLTDAQRSAIMNISEVHNVDFDAVVNSEYFAITTNGELISVMNGFLTLGRRIISELTLSKMIESGSVACMAK